ncbi:MAG: tetraacyldisaccharide 4'-kinase [Rikenellaceae bacterium]|nr:tetraacyldisaccharide 4'-kinase [Rikenellaceae bacterium]MCL2692578.1 tetraacyldisaccharide 4'-kinase [Rikenellaceae bacterium]
MFDWRILRSREYDIPVVCVGNITVGGTGKTPVVEMLVRRLGDEYTIAVLSRGYKRKTKGYVEVERGMSFLKTGDEPKQIKQKFPGVVVAVCEKRAEGIDEIRRRHPEVDLIILDDGFQHRYVKPWVNIVLMDYMRPVYQDHMLPWGALRDRLSQMHRADYVLVTKCPPDMSALDRRLVRKWLKLYPYQGLYFCHTQAGHPVPMFPSAGYRGSLHLGADVIAMSGIGNPEAFEKGLDAHYRVVDRLRYPDHHPYRSRDLADMERALAASPESVIVATEKDAVKLMGSRKIPPAIAARLYYLPIRMTFYEDTEIDFIKNLKNDLRTNPKDRYAHP